MNNPSTSLPIRRAIDLYLRDVRYSNCMPDWYLLGGVNYSDREKAIRDKIEQYASGKSSPRPAFATQIPRKRAGTGAATWLQPSVNDLMILQTCVSALAPAINQAFDRQRVFSYRYNLDPNADRLTEDQCAAWEHYKQQIVQRGCGSSHTLVMDLEQSFANISRARFSAFLDKFPGHKTEVKILRVLLDGFSPGGIPLINNALFFLANAYFSEVDSIVAGHTKDYIRWNDDYCIFDSKKSLETLYKDINREVTYAGFKLNTSKANIVASEDFCELVSRSSASEVDDKDVYTPVVSGNFLDASLLISSIKKTLQKPDIYLNDGIGRFQLALLRKLRDSVLPRPIPGSALDEFDKDLVNSPEILRGSAQLLKTYMANVEQAWRSVWLLFLINAVDLRVIKDKQLGGDVQQLLGKMQKSGTLPEVVKLWARGRMITLSAAEFERVSDLDYLEVGKFCEGRV